MRIETNIEPPGTLNLFLSSVIVTGWMGGQIIASSISGWTLVAFAVVFSFLTLPLYSLMHECEHNIFHKNKWINDVAGTILSAFFPGPFSFLRGCHLGHHRRNRTEAEMFEIIQPGDSAWKKTGFFYFMYLGGFWLSVPVSMIPLLLWPALLKSRMIQNTVSASAMVNGVPRHFYLRIRLECVFVLVLHLALIWSLNLNPSTYLLILVAGGINWSSQQYIQHAGSPLDVIHGAHNLKASRLYQKWILNFNWHLAHHQHPQVPWNMLPKFHDPSRDRPPYLVSFLKFWRGPRRLEIRRDA
jgi:fatty acid desaturase